MDKATRAKFCTLTQYTELFVCWWKFWACRDVHSFKQNTSILRVNGQTDNGTMSRSASYACSREIKHCEHKLWLHYLDLLTRKYTYAMHCSVNCKKCVRQICLFGLYFLIIRTSTGYFDAARLHPRLTVDEQPEMHSELRTATGRYRGDLAHNRAVHEFTRNGRYFG